MIRRQLVSWAVLLLLVVFVGTTPSRAEKISAVATFAILEDFVKQVGGELVETVSLVPFNVDPHSWEPSPKEARAVAEADILFANGGVFDQWLSDLQKSAAGPDVPLIVVSKGLADLGEEDPHYWLSVPNAVHYVEKITEALTELAPADAPYFAARSAAYIEELNRLDQSLVEELGQIEAEKRVIVTYHNAFSYFAKRYGFTVTEFLVHNPEGEPAARDMARLVEVLKRSRTSVVFSEPQISAGDRYLKALAKEIGGRVEVLYSDSLSRAVPTYIALMEYNKKTLLEALQ
ncbi:MAG TPA: zinc ABC transporter substrate-binding protein [Firmicutes bacterium]|nr:zinc ABC transporter substrate-binding protein [Bacillota bacterium]